MGDIFYNGANQGDIEQAAKLLAAGEVVAVPTETVYGLAADALNQPSVRRIFEIKGRPLIDPLIVHVAAWEMVENLTQTTARAKRLAECFWPGPLTMVLRKKAIVSDLVTAGCPTVAIRMPAHPVMRAILKASQKPLAAPSANPFGYISPTTAFHVRDSLGERLKYIVDGGPCAHGVESTIIDVSDDARCARILRHGPITVEMLEAALGEKIEYSPAKAAKPNQGMAAPGMLSRHYSPHTPCELIERGAIPTVSSGTRAAWVLLQRPRSLQKPEGIDIFFLSERGSLEEAARNTFSLLRALDKGGYDRIFIETPPAEGIGRALQDRLRRAAARN